MSHEKTINDGKKKKNSFKRWENYFKTKRWSLSIVIQTKI